MWFFISMIPATVWLVIGFFVSFATTKIDGNLRKFGRILAIWTFVIAALFPLGGAYVTIAGVCPMQTVMEQLHTSAQP